MDINSNFFEIGPYFIFQIFNCGQAIVNCAHNTNENNICLEPTSPQKSQLYFFLLCYLSFQKQYFVCCEFFSSKVKVAQHFSLNPKKQFVKTFSRHDESLLKNSLKRIIYSDNYKKDLCMTTMEMEQTLFNYLRAISALSHHFMKLHKGQPN